MRAHWFGAVGLALLAPLVALSEGCQGTCVTKADCGMGEYCSIAPNTCINATALGFCKAVPDSCTDVYNPVCGCDGKTYANPCEAAVMGAVSVAADGACTLPCGGPSNTACADGEYCEFGTIGACLGPNPTGTCQPRPTTCSPVSSQVCGCDGVTYANGCEAAKAGVAVAAGASCANLADAGGGG